MPSQEEWQAIQKMIRVTIIIFGMGLKVRRYFVNRLVRQDYLKKKILESTKSQKLLWQLATAPVKDVNH